VGRRFNDHPQIVLEWTPNRDLGSESADSWISGCLNFAASNGPISGDLQILQSNVSMSVLTGHSSARADTALPLRRIHGYRWISSTGTCRHRGIRC
jgi:hypothetical protein